MDLSTLRFDGQSSDAGRGPLWLKSLVVATLLTALPYLQSQIPLIESVREAVDHASAPNINQKAYDTIEGFTYFFGAVIKFGSKGIEVAGPAWPSRLENVPERDRLWPFRTQFEAMVGVVPTIRVLPDPKLSIHWRFWRDRANPDRWIAVASAYSFRRSEPHVVTKRKGGF